MPATATSRIRAVKQEYSSNPESWGGELNDGALEILDEAWALTSITVGANVTLTSNDFISDQARSLVLLCSGAGGFSITTPAVDKPYLVVNNCTSDITVLPSGGTAATVRAGVASWWYTDGSVGYVVDPTLDKIKTAAANVAMGGFKLTGVGTGTAATDAATLSNRPEQFATPTGPLAMGGQKITGLGTGTASTDAASLSNKVHEFAAPTAALAMNSQKITGLAAATASTDAASLANRLDQFAAPTGPLAMGGQKITGLGTGTASTDAASLSNKVHEFAAPTAALAMNSQKITGLAAATASTDAASLANRLDQFAAPTAAVSLNSQKITNLAAATASTDAASLANRLDQFAAPTASVSFNSQRATNLATPTDAADAVTKGYADAFIGTVSNAIDGTVSAPGIRFSADLDTGFYRVGADSIGVTTGGTNRLTVDAAAVTSTLPIYVPDGSVSAPSITNTGDTNTGLLFPAADTVAIATAGSERVRVDASGNVGIGTSSPNLPLHVVGNLPNLNIARFQNTASNGYSTILLDNDAGNVGLVIGYGGSTAATFASQGYLLTAPATPLILGTNNSERMRIDASGNVGIGTSAPQAPIHVNTTTTDRIIRLQNTASTAGVGYIEWLAGAARKAWLGHGAASSNDFVINTTENTSGHIGILSGSFFRVTTGGSERMRIDSSGNVGIGTSAPVSPLHVAGIAVLAGGVAGTSGLRIVKSGTTLIQQVGDGTNVANTGTDAWQVSPWLSTRPDLHVAPSGNVGIGTSSPAFSVGSGLEIERASADVSLRLERTTTDGRAFEIQVTSSATRISERSSNPLLFDVGATERMRIDSSGNVLIGQSSTTTPGFTNTTAGSSVNFNGIAFFSSSGASLYANRNSTDGTLVSFRREGVSVGSISVTTSSLTLEAGGSNALILGAGGSERARIDSSGNVLVGQSSQVEPGNGNTTTGAGIQATGTIAASRSGGRGLTLNRNTSDGVIAVFYREGLEVGNISVTTTATTYNVSSDYRLKSDVEDLTGSGAFIDALKPRRFRWNATGELAMGFIAHEAQQVATKSVTGQKDGDEMQAMDASSPEIMANVIAELQSLRARVAALETLH